MSRENIAAYIIALYVRLSSEDSKVDSLSIVNQLKALHHYVDTMDELAGAEVLEFVDNGYTGTTLSVPPCRNCWKWSGSPRSTASSSKIIVR